MPNKPRRPKLRQQKKEAEDSNRDGDAILIQKQIRAQKHHGYNYSVAKDLFESTNQYLEQLKESSVENPVKNWSEFSREIFESLYFREFNNKPRQDLFEYITSKKYRDESKFVFPDSEYMSYLLKPENIDKIPDGMKDHNFHLFIDAPVQGSLNRKPALLIRSVYWDGKALRQSSQSIKGILRANERVVAVRKMFLPKKGESVTP